MNHLSRLLPASNVLLDFAASSKKRAFEQAGLIFENHQGIARAKVFDSLFARERLGSALEPVLPAASTRGAIDEHVAGLGLDVVAFRGQYLLGSVGALPYEAAGQETRGGAAGEARQHEALKSAP